MKEIIANWRAKLYFWLAARAFSVLPFDRDKQVWRSHYDNMIWDVYNKAAMGESPWTEDK